MSVLLFCASVLLGGATHAGVPGDVILQFLAIPFLLAALWMWTDRLSRSESSWPAKLHTAEAVLGCAMAIVGAFILLAQFVPLFGSTTASGIWSEIVRQGASGAPPQGTGASSLAPDLGAAATAAILPALALFLLVALLDRRQRMRLVGWMVVAGLASLVLGVLQVMSGPTSPLRLHWPTNTEEAVGFFANRNHFAAQMYATLLLGIVWLADRGRGRFSGPAFTADKAQALGVAVSFVLLVAGAIFLTRSRTGIVLAILASLPLVVTAPTMTAILTGHRHAPFGARRKVAWAVAVILLLIATLGAERVLPRFENSVLNDARAPIFVTSLRAAVDALPFGSGLGTFVPVYQAHEPGGQIFQQYINRAHNDWVEFFIEAGIPGALLIVVFLCWFVLRFSAVWFRPGSYDPRDLLLERFSAFILLLILLHSAVDYPLRTGAMLGYFAVLCAFLIPLPAPEPQPSRRRSRPRAQHMGDDAFPSAQR